MIRLSAHLGYQFTEWPLAERFAAAAEAGYTAVEHPAPYALSAAEIAALLRRHKLDFVQLAAPSGNAAAGEKGLACLPGREADFAASLPIGIAYAKALGAPFLHVMAGVLPQGATHADIWPTYIANMQQAAIACAEAGLTLIIEPIGRGTIAGYAVDNPDLALHAIRDISAPNVRLLIDTFHCANSGFDALALLRAHHELIAHWHIADFPGRHEPGTGAFPFQALVAELKRFGYAGHLGCEYNPRNGTLAGLSWRDVLDLR